MVVTLGLIQARADRDPGVNLDKTCDRIRKAAAQGAQVICLQELFMTHYFCKTESLEPFAFAEAIPGPTTDRLCKLSEELEVVIIASLFEKRTAGLYHNTTAVIDADGTYLGKYRKMHIPDDPGFYEKYYFTEGDLGYKVWDTRYGKIGVLICWDQWYPEAARLTAMQGAQILVYPTAIGWLPEEQGTPLGDSQRHAWESVQRGHAVANGCYVAAINRVGLEDDALFWGGSFVANPYGQFIQQASGEEETLIVPVDLEELDAIRCTWPFFRDRRIDSYGDVTKRFIDPA